MRYENDQERVLAAMIKTVAYVVTWLVLALGIFRVAVPALWGMRSDAGMVLAIAVAIGGVVALLWGAFILGADVLRTGRTPPPPSRDDPPHVEDDEPTLPGI